MGENVSNFNKISSILKKYSTDVVSYKLDAEFAYAVGRAVEIMELLSYAEENALPQNNTAKFYQLEDSIMKSIDEEYRAEKEGG